MVKRFRRCPHPQHVAGKRFQVLPLTIFLNISVGPDPGRMPAAAEDTHGSGPAAGPFQKPSQAEFKPRDSWIF